MKTQKYVIGIETSCGPAVTVTYDPDVMTLLFDTKAEAQADIEDDKASGVDVSNLYVMEVIENDRGHWIGVEDEVDYTEIAIKQ